MPETLFSALFAGVYLYYAWRSRRLLTYLAVPSVLLAGAYIVSALFSVNLFQSRQSLYLLLAGMAVFQVAAFSAGDRSLRQQLLEAMGYSASFLSLYALFFSFNVGMTSGLYATFYNYNSFAGYLALSALALPALALSTPDDRTDTGLIYPVLGFLTVYLVWVRNMDYTDLAVWALLIGLTAVLACILLRHVGPRVRYLLFFLPVPAALAMTGSRGGLLSFVAATALALVVIVLKEPGIRKYALWFVAGMALLMAVLVSTQAGLIERFSLLLHPTNRSDLFRMLVWKGAWRAFLAGPWLGHGPGTFASVYPVYKAGGVDTLMAHNSYLQLLAETGVAGVAALAAFIVSALWRIRTRLQSAAWSGAAIAVPVAGIAAMAVHNAVDYTWFIPAHQIAFMALLGILAGIGKDENNPHSAFRIPHLLPRISAITMVLLISASALAALVWSMPAAVIYDKGNADLASGWRSYAETEIARAATVDPWSGKYVASLADLRASAGGNSDVVGLYRRAIALEKMNPYYRLRLAEYFLQTGEYDKATAASRQALKLSPNLRGAWRLIGDAEAAMKRYTAAAETYARVLHVGTMPYENEKYLPLGELLPRTEEGKAWLGLGRIYAMQGRRAEARSALLSARRIFDRYVQSARKNPLLADKKPEAERYEGLIISIDNELIRLKL